MICPVCGYDNLKGAKFCQKCGSKLNNYANLRNVNTYSQTNKSNQSKNNNVLIIAVTVIIIALILAGTFLFMTDSISLPFGNNENQVVNITQSDDSGSNSDSNQAAKSSETTKSSQSTDSDNVVYNALKVNTATFYLDGNPNTGITTTINVGKEHTGESMGVMTTFSRDGSNMNSPSSYEYCIVNDEGNIVFTDYTPIPKYPDYCVIGISYNNQAYRYACDMGKHKGSQTSVPREI